MASYIELKSRKNTLWECFYAFNDRQMNEGLEETGLSKSEITHYGYGLYGSKRGIKKYLNFYDELNKQIAEQCTAQEAYDYEFDNHECDYTGDDTAAMVIVLGIFPSSEVRKIDRRWAVLPIEKVYGYSDTDLVLS